MKTRRNPKQVGSLLYDCKPQVGLCPRRCSNCYYNILGAGHKLVREPIIPSVEDTAGCIVRVNALHDSNIDRELVIDTARRYKDYFFNTSVDSFDFPAPVVYTTNINDWLLPKFISSGDVPANIMFVRILVSACNIRDVNHLTSYWTGLQVPVVFTFMRFKTIQNSAVAKAHYEWKKFITHKWFCPKREFMADTMSLYKGSKLVSMCGTLDSHYCRDCKNCETYYYQTVKRMSLIHSI